MLLLLAILSASPLSTTAERSGFLKTGRFDEVQKLCRDFQTRFSDTVRCEQFGTTPMGRPLLYLALSQDGVFTAEANRQSRRPVVVLQGGIHAGEIDGKDAGFLLVRELLEGKLGASLLKRVTVVFIPVLNVDGHERVSAFNRPNQNGPREMGWRTTAQNFNLNRDFTKADAPEMRALLSLLHAYDPVLYADLHVTDGAKFQHDVSVVLEPWASGPDPLRALGVALKKELLEDLKRRGHLPLGFYPSFRQEDEPASGFEYNVAPASYSTSYWAANNRFGILVETHSWKDYKTRVAATHDVCAKLVNMASEHGQVWLAAMQAADVAESKRAGEPFSLSVKSNGESKVIDFLGYAYSLQTSSISGKSWIQYDERKKAVWKVPYFEMVVPDVVVTSPSAGYLIAPPHSLWLQEKLALHHLEFQVLGSELKNQMVQTFRVSPTFRATPFEGRMKLVPAGSWKDDVVTFPPQTLFVPAAQPKLRLLLALLEPASPDSFLQWGFFNAQMERKEYLETYLTEAFALEAMKDPAIKAAFEERLQDPAFAKSPEARLAFFAQRHPSADPTFCLYPIARTAQLPNGLTGRESR